MLEIETKSAFRRIFILAAYRAIMKYHLTGALMGWLIGDKLPAYIFRMGDYHKYLKPINAKGFANRIDYLLNPYHPKIKFAQLNLPDSHDTPRFFTTAGNYFSPLKLAWLLIFYPYWAALQIIRQRNRNIWQSKSGLQGIF